MKAGDLVIDTYDGIVGIITREPYCYGNDPLNKIKGEPNVVDILWSVNDQPVAMHLAAFHNGVKIIS